MKRFLIVTVFAVILWGGEYLRRGLWEPDEARYAYLAKEMRADGDWWVMHRHGELYPDKPPMMFWLINAFSALTGGEINRVSARLPSLLGAILSLWVTVTLATRWRDERAGWRAGLILSTCFLFWQVGGMGQLDSLLCGLEMAALYLLLINDETPSSWRAASAYAILGIAFLTKGPVGMVVPLGAYVTMRLASGQRAVLKKSHWIWGPVIVLAFPAAWLLCAWLDGAPREYFQGLFGQTGRRVMDGTGHDGPFYYFLLQFPLDSMPWVIFLPASYAALRARPDLTSTRRMLVGWLLFVLVFFSLPTDKRNLYVMLAFPPAAMLVAIAWDDLDRLSSRWRTSTAWTALGLMLLLGTAGVAVSFAQPLSIDRWLAGMMGMEFPFDPRLLWPWSAAMLGGAVAGFLLYRRHGLSERWMWTFGVVLLAHELYVGNVIYPALNRLKTPWELEAAATKKLRPDQRLLIYRVNGEIMALYANRQGQRVNSVPELKAAMAEQRKGIVALGQKAWEQIQPEMGERPLTPHPFRMGNKHLVWVEFDLDRDGGEKVLQEGVPSR